MVDSIRTDADSASWYSTDGNRIDGPITLGGNKKIGEIEQCLRLLDEGLVHLDKVIEDLESRLGPALRPMQEEYDNATHEEPHGAREATQSPLAMTLEKHVLFLNRRASQIRSLMARIDL